MRQFFIFCFGLYVWLLGSGCGKPQSVDVWPPLRPLGADTAIRTKESPLFSPPKGTLTLPQVLALSIQYGPNLPVAMWTVRAGEAKIKQASQRPNPELETELETLGEIETIIQLKCPIELGRKRLRRQTVAQLSARLSGWEYEGQRLDTLTETRLAFIDVLQAQALVAVNQGLVQLAEQIFSTVRTQVELGVKAGIEQALVQIELVNSRLTLKQSQQSLALARQALAATWGQATPTFDRVEGRLEAVSPVPPIEQLLEQMMPPELARWPTEIELRKAIVEIEKSNRRPDITVGGGFKHLSPFSGENSLMAVVSLSVPLPVLNQNRGAILVAESNLQKSQAERAKAETRLGAKLAQAHHRLVSAHETIHQLKDEIMPLAQSAFEVTVAGQRLSKIVWLELTNAQHTLFKVKRSYTGALAEYHRAVAHIERLIGQPLNDLVPGR